MSETPTGEGDSIPGFDLWKRGRERAARNRDKMSQYEAMSRPELAALVHPSWSLAPAHLHYNLKNLAFFPTGYSLCEGETEILLGLLHPDNQFDTDVLFPPHRLAFTIVEILQAWEAGTPLTPPILQPRDERIAVNDGMHRLAACSYLQASRIPFYVKREHEAWFLAIPTVTLTERGTWP